MLLPSDHDHPLKGKDFYKYVNGKWLDSVHVPPHISSFGVSEELELSIQKQLQRIVNTCVWKSKTLQNPNSSDEMEVAIGKFAQSALNAKVQKKSVKFVDFVLRDLRCLRDKQDIGRTLGELVKYKIPGVFWLFGQYENQNKTKYTYTLGIGKVGLPDLSYYKKTAPGKSKTLLKYANLLQSAGKLFQIDNLSQIIPLEELLAAAIQKSLSDKSFEMKGADLEKEYSDIPFGIIFETMGLANWREELFFVDSKNWMKVLEKMFQHLPIESWKLLFSTEIILHFLPYLPPPFDDIYFEFFHHHLRGQTKKMPQKDLTLLLIQNWMTPFISKLYVEKQEKNGLKKHVCEFVKQLKEAAENRCKNTEWLQPSTRTKAAEKVKKMLTSIGYPDEFGKLSIPDLNSEILSQNLMTLGAWQTQYEINRLGEKRSQQKDWDEPIFAVNAYYYSQSNEIVIPLGSLYWPFYSPSSSFGWNYGGLGCVLGHEMTHAFDKEGKEYDPDGFPKKWWTPNDNRAYNKKSKELIQLFGEQKVLEHPVSGSLTLSENIADLGGMAIALDALGKEIEKKKLSEEERKKAYQQFFLSYAVSWRVKEKPEKTLQSLFLDYHAPPSLRVNLIVSQFDEWYQAFDITEKDVMFIPPEKRIRIF